MEVKVAALLLGTIAGRYRVKERDFKSANTEVPSPTPVLPQLPTDHFPMHYLAWKTQLPCLGKVCLK